MWVLFIFLITQTLQIELATIPYSDWMVMLAVWFPSRGWWPWSILEFWMLQCQQAFFVRDFWLSSAFASSPVLVLFSLQGRTNTDVQLICNFYFLQVKNIKQSKSKTGRDLKGEWGKEVDFSATPETPSVTWNILLGTISSMQFRCLSCGFQSLTGCSVIECYTETSQTPF